MTSDFIIFEEGAAAVLSDKRIPRFLREKYRPSELLRALWDGALSERESGILIPVVGGSFADFLGFNLGRAAVEDTGWPASVKFDVSTNAVADFTAATTYASRAPITGTGYAQASQAEPAATGLGVKTFTQMSWATGSATDWTNPKSIVASDGSTYNLCAWNLIAGGAARDMSQANTTLNVTPTYSPSNP